MSTVRWWMAVGAAVCCFGCAVGAKAQFVPNLALNRPVTVTSSFADTHPKLVDDDFAHDWGWHFAAPYGTPPVPSDGSPYFGAVDLAGAGNTITVRTVRIEGEDRWSCNPAAWTLQSRDSAADPLDPLVRQRGTVPRLRGTVPRCRASVCFSLRASVTPW